MIICHEGWYSIIQHGRHGGKIPTLALNKIIATTNQCRDFSPSYAVMPSFTTFYHLDPYLIFKINNFKIYHTVRQFCILGIMEL